MAEHVWTVLCQKTLVDERAGTISLIDIAERLTLYADARDAIAQAEEEGRDGIRIPSTLQLVSVWTRSDLAKGESVDARVTFVDPSGKWMHRQGALIDLVSITGRRLIVNIEGLGITGAGRYWFEVERKKSARKGVEQWALVARVPLEVDILDGPGV